MAMHGNSLLKNGKLKIQGMKQIKQKMCYLEVPQYIFFFLCLPRLVPEDHGCQCLCCHLPKQFLKAWSSQSPLEKVKLCTTNTK